MKIGFVSCFDYINFGKFEEFGFEKANSLLDFDLLLWDIGFLHLGYHGKNGFRKLLKDRQRRLNELRIFLDSGKTLVVLLGDINHLKQRVSNNIIELGGVLKQEGLSPENVDVFSFLPPGLEKIIRGNVVESRGKRIDFKGDKAFLPAWKILHKVAWYDAYFTKPVGTPFLFVSETQLPVATWIPYLNGNVFFIPSTEFDANDDYPEFVEAAIQLKLGLDNLTGRLVEILWQNIEKSSFKNIEPKSPEASSSSTSVIPERFRKDLRIKVVSLFNSSEVRDLCFDLNISYDEVSISGGRFSDTVREIILFCEKNGILAQLIAWCQRERPNEDWSGFI